MSLNSKRSIIAKVFCIIVVLGCTIIGQATENDSLLENKGQINVARICRWKGGVSACVNLSFDDNNISACQIAKILDQYGYKGTFFFNTYECLFPDSVLQIGERQHEIGNHTFSHNRFTQDVDSATIDFEIRKSKEILENVFGIKCVSFAEPGHVRSDIGTHLIFKYHLFCRNYSEYIDVEQVRLPFSQLTTKQLSSSLNDAMRKGTFLKLSGHGIDGDGYLPTKRDFLLEVLDTLKSLNDKEKIWITTLKDGSLYENLYYELSLNQSMQGDTLLLTFNDFNKNKYEDYLNCPISVEIPSYYCEDVICLTKKISVIKRQDRFILTMDLMRDSVFKVKLNNYNNFDSIRLDERLLIYPNPASNYINLEGVDTVISAEIYDLAGKHKFTQASGLKRINVASLTSGVYIVKVICLINGSKHFLYKRFIMK